MITPSDCSFLYGSLNTGTKISDCFEDSDVTWKLDVNAGMMASLRHISHRYNYAEAVSI